MTSIAFVSVSWHKTANQTHFKKSPIAQIHPTQALNCGGTYRSELGLRMKVGIVAGDGKYSSKHFKEEVLSKGTANSYSRTS